MKNARESARRREFADEFRRVATTCRWWDVDLLLTETISRLQISGQAYHALCEWMARCQFAASTIERELEYRCSPDSCWWQAVRQVSPGLFHRKVRR